jgi:hypothetical protein
VQGAWLETIIMPSNFKTLVRARMGKTGESWQTAERHVRGEAMPNPQRGGASENDVEPREDGGEVADDFDAEDCATSAEAVSAARRFARARSVEGYEVNILDGEPGLVSVWVKRAVDSPDGDFAENEKQFTFPDAEDDAPHNSSASQAPSGNAPADPAPQPLESLADLLDALALSLPELEAFTAPDANPYEHFTIAKRDRSRRTIAKPDPRLKAVQRRILRLIVERLPAHGASHGHRVGRSTATNAAVHVNPKVLVKVDLRDFSSAITLPRARGVFRHAGYPEPVARALALLCTAPDALGVRRLPQGAPTTSGLANAVCFQLDRRLSDLASRRGLRFTRYGDDLAFSMPAGEAEPSMSELLGAIKGIVVDEGFRLNPDKTRIERNGAQQRVTALMVNGPGEPRLPGTRELKRRLRAAAHNLHRKPDAGDRPK